MPPQDQAGTAGSCKGQLCRGVIGIEGILCPIPNIMYPAMPGVHSRMYNAWGHNYEM